MNYRRLGKTGLMVSEIGLGGEWLERHSREEVIEVVHSCQEKGINIVDCWMSNPEVRSNIGEGIKGSREKWIIQGQIGSTWQNGQYEKTRDLEPVKAAFQDLLDRFQTDYMDIGMIHFIDEQKDWDHAFECGFMDYVKELKAAGKIRHIGISTHNPKIGKQAAESGFIEMILFSINPAFDLLPATENIDDFFADDYDASLAGMDPERAEFYKICEQNDVGITVMKGYAGGRLFDAARSPFGVALTPVQCLHYALTRPAVASVLTGVENEEQILAAIAYETATDEEKDYASVLAHAPMHAYSGQCTYCGHCAPCPMEIDIAMVNKYYDLAVMQPEVPATLKAHYADLSHHADECIGCQNCEARCPFGVSIAERMQKTAELFG